MRLQLTVRTLWLLPILLAGCSTTVGQRFGGTPQSRSIAVVGDRPLPASTGEPGGRVVADVEEPEPKLNSKRRISGRVVNEAGDPVPGATVRLADSGVKGGKQIRATTDRSGAFTLNGLRPGSSYTLIAESDDEHGAILGRAEASTADTGVEIALASDDKKPTTRRSARPSASKAKPVSNREDLEQEPDQEALPKVNREDIALPADEADALDPGPPQPQPVRAGRPQLSAPEPSVGWRNSKNATASRPKNEDVEADSVPTKRRQTVKDQPSTDPDDEANPLPPALDRGGSASPDDSDPVPPTSARSKSNGTVGAKAAKNPQEAGEIALAPEASLDEKADRAKSLANDKGETSLANEVQSVSSLMPDPDQAPTIPTPTAEVAAARIAAAAKAVEPSATAPPELPPIGGDPVKVAVAEAPSPTTSPPGTASASQVVAPLNPAPQPDFSSNPPAVNSAEKPSEASDYNPFANLQPAHLPLDRVVENAPLVSPPAEGEPVKATEIPKKKWGDLAATNPPAMVVHPTKATLTGALLRRLKPPVEPKDPSVATCSYDSRLRKLNDFRLPDLEGKPVQFRELDADYILLDFWGTWCAPCLDAIPHLVELQKKYGPGKLKVVGIACENVPPEQRKAKVEEVSRKLGINYPVLLSTMDGKACPIQQAFQIQAMPTMILVDRKGQVVWRSSGNTPANESRLDRVLAQSLARGDTVRR
jgi:thiol-disulfide isomerase/thioredoxin